MVHVLNVHFIKELIMIMNTANQISAQETNSYPHSDFVKIVHLGSLLTKMEHNVSMKIAVPTIK